ncbi:uracil-DNA glycosylase [Corynebacterium phocae]|uniref:Uracil-DNA glycosylase n=1 Tax=Corynebacterium phocae TaxID=161895 RepID=A0A1L7D3W9_9CORY|nr:uracil-DNA glycosylase [Corynebacterium phocae]APT92622.1 uracil-DNA glycosylase [Corynebacterium phocae]KAA8724179.1 uracil-DNA glycosylase [Corynebacterium phocae]
MSNYHPSWEPFIGSAVRQYLPGIKRHIGRDFLPEDYFAALRMPHDQVRVLIVGQDPYPTPGHAMGLSFSTAPGVKPPRSLANIYAELASDIGVTPPEDGDLRPWTRQGVLLLNRVLTVQPGQAGSHRKIGWEHITEAAIRSLNRAPMVAVLWGKDAQACAKFLADVPVVTAPHPSPLSARRGFFGSKPFSQVNQFLQAQDATPIDWRL